MQRRSGPKKDTVAPVRWEEVWWWARDIQRRWGYWTKIEVCQPIDELVDERFTVNVNLSVMDVKDPRSRSSINKWRKVDGLRVTVELTALQLLVEVHRSLDSEELEAERAALVQGALF
jgi:hypothetical protein